MSDREEQRRLASRNRAQLRTVEDTEDDDQSVLFEAPRRITPVSKTICNAHQIMIQ